MRSAVIENSIGELDSIYLDVYIYVLERRKKNGIGVIVRDKYGDVSSRLTVLSIPLHS